MTVLFNFANTGGSSLLSGRGEPEAQHCEQIVLDSGLNCTVVKASLFNHKSILKKFPCRNVPVAYE